MDNLYQRIRVCYYCLNMYEKIDSNRIQQLEKSTKYALSQQQIQAYLNSQLNSQAPLYGSLMS